MTIAIVVNAQNDSIIYRTNFICYRQHGQNNFDTLNRIDKNGLKQGKWIEYDSSKTQTCEYHYPTVTKSDYRLSYRIKWCGLYIDNKKQGLWVNSYSTGNTRIELFYKNGVIQMPVIE